MNNEKFTPGKWRLTAHKRNILIYHRRDVDVGLGQIVAIIEASSDEEVENAVANARLIAAAPEMYDLLRTHCRECERIPGNENRECELCEFNRVLKKARGEE